MSQILDFKNNNNYEKLKIPANIIRNAGIVVFPTETVYGIGTSGLNEYGIKRLYEIKQRPLNKPISLLVSNIDMIHQVAESISELEYRIIKNFFPGPLTIVLKKKKNISNILTSNGDTVGVRMPANNIALKLIEYAGVPIAATSANISGNISEIYIDRIISDFNENVDCFIDNGKSKIGIASTVIKIENEEIKILRQGSITYEMLLKKL